jgi:hypothetical protein
MNHYWGCKIVVAGTEQDHPLSRVRVLPPYEMELMVVIQHHCCSLAKHGGHALHHKASQSHQQQQHKKKKVVRYGAIFDLALGGKSSNQIGLFTNNSYVILHVSSTSHSSWSQSKIFPCDFPTTVEK